jgi:hypothetical protein
MRCWRVRRFGHSREGRCQRPGGNCCRRAGVLTCAVAGHLVVVVGVSQAERKGKGPTRVVSRLAAPNTAGVAGPDIRAGAWVGALGAIAAVVFRLTNGIIEGEGRRGRPIRSMKGHTAGPARKLGLNEAAE